MALGLHLRLRGIIYIEISKLHVASLISYFQPERKAKKRFEMIQSFFF